MSISLKISTFLLSFHLTVQLCFLLLLSSLTTVSVAQPIVHFKTYDVTDGLSHNYVRSVLQDSEGFIWVATEDGLNKFNSYTFKVYKHVPDDSSSLTNHPVMTLEEDKNHNIWIGTWGGGIFIYNRALDNFRRLQHIDHREESRQLSSNFIYDLFSDSKGNMWVGTGGRGVDRISLDADTFTHFRHDAENPQSLSHNRVNSITEDEEGTLWMSTFGGGLNRFYPETGTFEHYGHQEGNPQSLSHNDATCVFYDSQQRLWVGTWDNGLNMMEKNSGTFTHFQHDPDQPHSIGNNQVWTIMETPDKGLWIGTDNGLSLYNEKENNFYVYRNNPFDPKSIVANSIKSLYKDKQGRLWAGTVNAGMSMFDKHFIRIQHYYTKLNENSLSFNDVSAFLQLPDGDVLVGTDGGGLSLLDMSTGYFSQFRHDPDNPQSLGSDKVKAMLQDSQGNIWIGFWGGGLDYFDQRQRTFRHYRKNTRSPDAGLNSDNIISLAEDQDGYLWLATYGGGLNKFDPDKQSFTTYIQQADNPQSLSDRQIWTVLVDHENNVWAGTSNGRLDLLDRDKDHFIHVIPQPLGESRHAVQVLFEDSQHRIWLGLEGGGLKLLDKATRTFQTFTTEQGLPSNNINAIEEAEDGCLWLSTNNGLARFDPQTGQCENFDVGDGLQGLHFNRQASGKLTSGALLFGGVNGFNMFHPDSLKDMSLAAPIAFTDFQIFNKPVPVRAEDSPLKMQINQAKSLTLSYKHSVFSLEYAALNYTTPGKIRYRYRLKNFVDESWQEAGRERKVTYTNLKPGNYLFEVAIVSGNENLEPVRTLSITVIPPWWQTWWARLLAGLLFCTVLVTVYRLRLRNIKKTNKRLEEEVAERTLKLQQANDSLRAMNLVVHEKNEEIQAQAEELAESNEEIRSINQQLEERVNLRTSDLKKSNEELDNFVYRVSHDIRAPLSSLLGLMSLIEDETDPDQLKMYLKMATTSINKLDDFVKDILNYSRNSRMQITQEEVDFPELLDNVLEELKYMDNAHRLRIIRELHIENPYYSDPRRLHIIFRNLFSNAIKYQNMREPCPFVKVTITTGEQEVMLVVEDNGVGIPSPQIDKVFNMFYRGSELSNGSGIGLYIVKETIEKLGGRIQLQSQPGEGTQFTIVLPQTQPEEQPDTVGL